MRNKTSLRYLYMMADAAGMFEYMKAIYNRGVRPGLAPGRMSYEKLYFPSGILSDETGAIMIRLIS